MIYVCNLCIDPVYLLCCCYLSRQCQKLCLDQANLCTIRGLLNKKHEMHKERVFSYNRNILYLNFLNNFLVYILHKEIKSIYLILFQCVNNRFLV